MIVLATEQRTPDWYFARLGKLTASCAGDMLARIKTGEAAARRDLRLRLVCERLTGRPQEDVFVSPAMQHGMDTEAAACAAYEAVTGVLVQRTGFVAHDVLPAGCSPDGYIGEFEGLLEIKCPKSATHLKYLRGRVAPPEYLPQIVHSLWITGAQWCDFVSFDDRFAPALQLFTVRVPRVQVDIDAYELMARTFLHEVDSEVAALSVLEAAAVA